MKTKDTNYWFEKGVHKYRKKNYITAIKYFDEGLKIEPNNVKLLFMKATVLILMFRHGEALPYLELALKYYQPNPGSNVTLDLIYTQIGNTLGLMGRHGDADQYYDKSLNINPENISVLLCKSDNCLEMGKLNDAFDYFKRAFLKDPNNENVKDFWNDKLRDYIHCKKCGEQPLPGATFCQYCGTEIEVIDKEKIELVKNPMEMVINRINKKIQDLNFLGPMIYFAQWRKNFPDSSDVRRIIANIDFLNSFYLKYIGIPSTNGVLEYKIRDADEILAEYDKALEIDPNSSITWNNKGVAYFWLYYPKTKYSEALECIDYAISLNPNNYIAWLNKGWILKFISNNEEHPNVLECFEKAKSICHNLDTRKLSLRIENNFPLITFAILGNLEPECFNQ